MPSNTSSPDPDLQSKLVGAIMDKNLVKVCTALDQGATPSGSHRNRTIAQWLMSHFDSKIGQELLDRGLRLSHIPKLVRYAVHFDSVDALRFLRKNTHQKSQPELSDWAWCNQHYSWHDKPKVSLHFLQTLAADDVAKLAKKPYEIALVWSGALKNNTLAVLDTILLSLNVNSYPLGQAGLKSWLDQGCKTATIEDLKNLDEYLKCPHRKAAWDQLFPIQTLLADKNPQYMCNLSSKHFLPENIEEKNVQIKDVLSALVLSGAGVVAQLSKDPNQAQQIAQILTNSAHMVLFMHHSSRAHVMAVIKEIKPHLLTWKDECGNHVGHYIASFSSPSKALVNELMKLEPSWVIEDNNKGSAPASALPEDLQSFAQKKVLKSALPVTKPAPSIKKRM